MVKPVHSIKNQYLGINAHLQSKLQTDGGWDSFHAIHLGHLTTAIQVQLRPMGYEADIEQSLQIKHSVDPARYPKADVMIYDPDPGRAFQPVTALSSANTQEIVMPIPSLLNITDEQVEFYRAIAIYKVSASRQDRGEPIVWIELLSPSNKPTGRDFESYREKRTQILQAGIVFVEIDYLHQYPPTLAGVANYHPYGKNSKPQLGSHPYRITVIDPRPDFLEGQGRSRQFDVDDRIPVIVIPLSASDKLDFDFGAPYRKTFEEMFYGDKVDYSQLPVNFELYSEFDQTRIASRMLAVVNAAQNDVDLEREPQAVETIHLGKALEQIQAIS